MILIIAKNANRVIIISQITLFNCLGKFSNIAKIPKINQIDIDYYFSKRVEIANLNKT